MLHRGDFVDQGSAPADLREEKFFENETTEVMPPVACLATFYVHKKSKFLGPIQTPPAHSEEKLSLRHWDANHDEGTKPRATDRFDFANFLNG